MKIFSLFILFAAIFSSKSVFSDSSQSSEVEFKSGPEKIRAFLSVPQKKGKYPAIILIHEWWGLNDWIKENAKRYSEKGYVALAVDLYRSSVTDKPDEAHELMRGLPDDRAIRDLKAAYEFLKTRDDVDKSKIGSMGWCMGGGFALQTAIEIPELSAVVVTYGKLFTDRKFAKKISSPVLGIFGEQDKGIPPESVRSFEKLLISEKKNVQIKIYSGVGHAFMNPANKKGFNKRISDEAWVVIDSFLDKNLK
ncbi:MAG: dienelactone hydrolase family protein [Leptospira sp.]|nr:dienelactone hydrolase family protein [Leptospira sp.]